MNHAIVPINKTFDRRYIIIGVLCFCILQNLTRAAFAGFAEGSSTPPQMPWHPGLVKHAEQATADVSERDITAPVHIHPENPKLFEFKGKPIVLICATEHYGSVMNRPFDFEKYLADAADKKQTLTRLFLLFRELQSAMNPYSTCKPESPDYISPFLRTGPENALDGMPKYDLDKYNPEFFDRLHHFLSLASQYGIVVEVVLLSNTYAPQIWALNPLNSANNINDVESFQWYDYMTKRHPKIFARQLDYVKKVIRELNQYDNIIYEICNEPGGNLPGNNAPPSEEVDEWISAIIGEIRNLEATLPNRHLIAGQEAFKYKLPEEEVNRKDVHQFCGKSFKQMDYDVVNMHPLSNMWYADKNYDLGRFMKGSLHLRQFRDYCLATYTEHKPLNLDEDNAATRFIDVNGWTIHRKRAWTALMCGAHYDMIDFSINKYMEAGTRESQNHIRTWMKNLSEFIHSIDLVHAKPLLEGLEKVPESVCASVLGVEGLDYNIYLADERESEDPGAGMPIKGNILLDLPEGEYTCKCYSPVKGLYSPVIRLQGGKNTTVEIPGFEHDVVVRITKVKAEQCIKDKK
jgi:hypothetical protein